MDYINGSSIFISSIVIMAFKFHVLCVVVFLSLYELGYTRSLHSTQKEHNLEIIGGVEITPHTVPEIVYLKASQWNTASGAFKTFECAGTLLSRRFVLTAAHCVFGMTNATVAIGIHNKRIQEAGNEYIKAAFWKIHPQYNPQMLGHDLAIITLAREVSYVRNSIRPVILPRRRDVAKDYAGIAAEAYGWGLTADNGAASDVLRGVRVPVISLENCRYLFSHYGMSVPQETVCTATTFGGVPEGICNGDSGGPLFDRQLVQIGVTSFSTSECEIGAPDGFVRVASYLDWIEQNSDVKILD